MINLAIGRGDSMARPRGHRTQQVAVYLSPAEAAAWDVLRDIQRGAGDIGWYPLGRGAWVAERVELELDRLAQAGHPLHAPRAEQALRALDEEEDRLGPMNWDRSHGRIRDRPRSSATMSRQHQG
jgi:hypothetical protein